MKTVIKTKPCPACAKAIAHKDGKIKSMSNPVKYFKR